MNKVYIVYGMGFVEGKFRTYIEGAFTNETEAKDFYEIQCADYQGNEMLGFTVYLTEWIGDNCETLEHYDVEECEEEDEND